MKKIVSSLLVICMVLAMTACGGKEQTVTYQLEQEQDGLVMVDTMKLDAKGDKVQKLTETIEIDMTAFDADQQAMMVEMYAALVDQYNAIDGTECTAEEGDGTYTLTIVVDTTGDAVSKLAEAGLMEVEGSTSGISLKKTAASLEASGYTLVE